MRSAPQTLTQTIAEEIRVLCTRQGKRQVDIAEAAGMSQAAVSERLRGLRAFNLDQLERICDALDTDLTELLSRARRAA